MRRLIISATLSILILFFIVGYEKAQFLRDGKLHVIFCDVGQGDAIFIKTPSGKDILIDGGPNDSVLSCLSNNMSFWDRELDLMFLTHPHADHFVGLISVLQRYSLKSFHTENLENKTAGFAELLRVAKAQKKDPHYVLAGDKFKTRDGVEITILGPSKEFIQETSPGGVIGESREFASLIILVSYGEFNVLLTGDSQIPGLSEAFINNSVPSIEVLQVPHHGSRFGFDKALIDEINPKLAAISVGKNNYGHPSKEILKILSEKDIKILRTDQHGEVEIVSDGKKFEIF